MSKKTILHSLVRVGSGGVEQRRLLLAKYLKSEDYSHAIICTEAFGGLVEDFEKLGVNIYIVKKLSSPFDIVSHCQAIKIIKKVKPDIIHGAVFEGNLIASFSGFLSGVKNIILEETSHPVRRSKKGKLLFKYMSFLAKKVVAVSPAVEAFLHHELGLKKNKIVLINNGVDSAETVCSNTRIEVRRSWGVSDDDFLFGAVGRVEDNVKRFSDIIDALHRSLISNQRLKLVIIGDGPDLNLLKEKVQSLNLSKNVIFLGYRSDVKSLYQCMDTLCLASTTESFGLVLAEAMSAGLPTIATRVGGVPFVVEDGQTGFIVAPYNVIQISEKMILLANDQKLARKMGGRGRLKACSEFSAERYTSDVALLYKSLC